MADIRAKDLTNTLGHIDTGDYFAVDDASTGETRKASKEAVIATIPDAVEGTRGLLSVADKAALDGAVAVEHSHDNKTLMDSYDQTNANLTDAVSKKHAHSNATELNAITTGVKAKYDAIAANADSGGALSAAGIQAAAVTVDKLADESVAAANLVDSDDWVFNGSFEVNGIAKFMDGAKLSLTTYVDNLDVLSGDAIVTHSDIQVYDSKNLNFANDFDSLNLNQNSLQARDCSEGLLFSWANADGLDINGRQLRTNGAWGTTTLESSAINQSGYTDKVTNLDLVNGLKQETTWMYSQLNQDGLTLYSNDEEENIISSYGRNSLMLDGYGNNRVDLIRGNGLKFHRPPSEDYGDQSMGINAIEGERYFYSNDGDLHLQLMPHNLCFTNPETGNVANYGVGNYNIYNAENGIRQGFDGYGIYLRDGSYNFAFLSSMDYATTFSKYPMTVAEDVECSDQVFSRQSKNGLAISEYSEAGELDTTYNVGGIGTTFNNYDNGSFGTNNKNLYTGQEILFYDDNDDSKYWRTESKSGINFAKQQDGGDTNFNAEFNNSMIDANFSYIDEYSTKFQIRFQEGVLQSSTISDGGDSKNETIYNRDEITFQDYLNESYNRWAKLSHKGIVFPQHPTSHIGGSLVYSEVGTVFYDSTANVFKGKTNAGWKTFLMA